MSESETGELLYTSFESQCEFWEIECKDATVTVVLDDSGRILDAVIWRDGKGEQLDFDKARPILEAAIEHHER